MVEIIRYILIRIRESYASKNHILELLHTVDYMEG